MISNQTSPQGHAGFRETYERMKQKGELASFRFVTPMVTAAAQGHDASLAELMRAGQEDRPDVILVASLNALGHDRDWIKHFLRCCGSPVVLYWDGDAWSRWAKPINDSRAAWLASADIVFATARALQITYLRRRGAQQVRFMPNTYCHVMFADAERMDPLDHVDCSYDAVMIGSGIARWGRISRVPGAVQRAHLVRRLQQQRDFRIAIYGAGWSGCGARGMLPY